MVRKLNFDDKEEYMNMASAFYSSNAVSHKIPKEYFERAFQAVMENNPMIRLYILEQQGNTAGYAAIAVTFTTEGGGNTLWLDELYIKEEYRSQGLGRELIRFLKNDKSVKRIRLEITPENERAKKLYISEGFEPCNYSQLICEL